MVGFETKSLGFWMIGLIKIKKNWLADQLIVVADKFKVNNAYFFRSIRDDMLLHLNYCELIPF